MVKTIDNSNTFYQGLYGDVSINIAASTTLKKGTVLGIDTTKDSATQGKIIAFDSTKCSDASYILASDITNEAESAADISLVRVFECGEVNRNKLIFINSADKTSASVLANLKANGIVAVQVHEETI